MAKSIRIRVNVNDLFMKETDPFWLYLSTQEYPFISDVEKKIFSMCKEIFSTHGRGDEDVNNTTLWLDGCRLPPSEKTELLRDNDSVTLQCLKYSKKHEARSKICVAKEHCEGKRKRRHSSNHNDCSPLESSTEKVKRHLKKKKKDNIGDNVWEEFSSSSDHKKSKKSDTELEQEKPSSTEDLLKKLYKQQKILSLMKSSLSSSNVSDTIKVKPQKAKKIREEDEPIDKRSRKTHAIQDATNGGPNYINNENIERTICNPLGSSLSHETTYQSEEHSVNIAQASGDSHRDSKLPVNRLNISQSENNLLIDDSEETETKVKRKRRRKSKKQKSLPETPKILKVEDKPRSSKLKLPWDQRPQNSKITFNSESGEEEVVEEEKDSQPFQQNGKIDEKIEIQHQQHLHSKNNGASAIDTVSITGRGSSGDRPPKKSPGVSSFSSNKARKRFMLRSTMGILDTLRCHSNQIADTTSAKKSSSKDVRRRNELNTNLSPVSASNSLPLKQNNVACTSFEKSYSPSDVKASLNAKSNEASLTSTPPMSKCKKSMSPSVFDTPVPSLPNSIAKLNELLQRKKLCNASCTINTTQNGVTVCSRNKSPGWNSNNEMFVNPATDVLTNKSTIEKLNSIDASHESTSPKPLSYDIKKMDNTASQNKDLVHGKVEVIPLDVNKCPPLYGDPHIGDIIAYKILELSDDYSPLVSNVKTGKVLFFENGVVSLQLYGKTDSVKRSGKFELNDENEEENESVQENEVCVDFSSMMDVQLVHRGTQG